jgi:hypothetical protein
MDYVLREIREISKNKLARSSLAVIIMPLFTWIFIAENGNVDLIPKICRIHFTTAVQYLIVFFISSSRMKNEIAGKLNSDLSLLVLTVFIFSSIIALALTIYHRKHGKGWLSSILIGYLTGIAALQLGGTTP